MAVFPLPLPDGIYSLRFYQTGTATANYTDNQWAFTHPDGSGNQAWSHGFRIIAAIGASLTFTFDGVTTHGTVSSGETLSFLDRYEPGIAIKGSGNFQIEAW